MVAIRAAPGRRTLPPLTLFAVGLGALACLGTLATLLLGQWDGLSALGLAITYACLRGRRPATAGAILAVTALIAKPHLALGLAAFVIGMRDRRLLLGAAGGVVASLLLSLLVAGPAGIAGFVGAAIHSTTRWQLANMVSLVGIPGSIAGNGAASHVLAAVGSLVAMGLAAALGSAARNRPVRMEAALAGAVVLSLLAARLLGRPRPARPGGGVVPHGARGAARWCRPPGCRGRGSLDRHQRGGLRGHRQQCRQTMGGPDTLGADRRRGPRHRHLLPPGSSAPLRDL
jgi:hypothetical protein